jgi:hypothetical protein
VVYAPLNRLLLLQLVLLLLPNRIFSINRPLSINRGFFLSTSRPINRFKDNLYFNHQHNLALCLQTRLVTALWVTRLARDALRITLGAMALLLTRTILMKKMPVSLWSINLPRMGSHS